MKMKIAMTALPLYQIVENELTKAVTTKRVEIIEKALASHEKNIQLVQSLIAKSIPAVRKAQDAVAFLRKIQELEERLTSLLNGPILSNVTVDESSQCYL